MPCKPKNLSASSCWSTPSSGGNVCSLASATLLLLLLLTLRMAPRNEEAPQLLPHPLLLGLKLLCPAAGCAQPPPLLLLLLLLPAASLPTGLPAPPRITPSSSWSASPTTASTSPPA